jgi:hypothetical protein
MAKVSGSGLNCNTKSAKFVLQASILDKYSNVLYTDLNIIVQIPSK